MKHWIAVRWRCAPFRRRRRTYLVVASRPNRLHVIDLAARRVSNTFEIPGKGVVATITLPKDGKVAYVLTNRNESVVGIDLESGKQVFRADMSEPGVRVKSMFAVAVSQDGTAAVRAPDPHAHQGQRIRGDAHPHRRVPDGRRCRSRSRASVSGSAPHRHAGHRAPRQPFHGARLGHVCDRRRHRQGRQDLPLAQLEARGHGRAGPARVLAPVRTDWRVLGARITRPARMSNRPRRRPSSWAC